jgi:hypothetical protein
MGTAIQRDDSFLKVGDPNINVCPSRYDESKFLSPVVGTHINLEKSLKIGAAEKNQDFRALG